MKGNLKRILAVTLTAAMATGIFAGCGGGGGSGSSAGGSSAGGDAGNASAATESKSGGSGGKEIVFWNIYTESPSRQITDDAVKRFNESTQSGYTVTNVPTQNDQYKQKLTVAMSSGQCPNIYTHWSGGPMNEYIDSGYAVSIDEYMKKDNYKDRFLDAAIAQATYQDKIYALPFNNCSVAGVFYNKDMYAQYGLTVPTTLAELEKNCEVLKENGKIPFALANASKWTGSMYFMYFASRMGGLEPFNEAVAGTGSFEADNFKYAGQKVQEWVDKGYFPEGVNGLDEDAGQAKQLMYTEDAAMQLHGSWMASTYKTDSEEFYAKIDWFPFPAIEGGHEDNSILVGTIGDNFMSFNCEGEMLDAAFEFGTYMIDDTAVQQRIDAATIPPLKEVTVADPVLSKVFESVQKASAVQLWYDQYLPPEVSEVHQSTCQELFGKTMTPEQADQKFQEAMQSYLASK